MVFDIAAIEAGVKAGDFKTYGNKDKRAELLAKWDNEVSVIPR